MDYRDLDKTAMCFKCQHKEFCKIVDRADTRSIQLPKWYCEYYLEKLTSPLPDKVRAISGDKRYSPYTDSLFNISADSGRTGYD